MTSAQRLFVGGGLSPGQRPKGPYARRFKRPLKHEIPNIMLSDWDALRREVPDFQEGVRYTQRELLILAEKMLVEDPKPNFEDPVVLLIPHLKERQKREIYNKNGSPDPSIQSGMYWRTHPQGRKVNSDEIRKRHGASYYR